MSAKILIGHPLQPKTIKALNERFEVHCISEKQHKHQQLLSQIKDYDALFAIGHKVDKALMDKGKKLKIIGNFGVGVDNIDIEYARQKGIVVTNTPRSTAIPTANFTIALILALMYKIVFCDHGLRKGTLTDWGDRKLLGTSPEGKVLGIIGMGRIGKAVAQKASSFGMKIWYHNRNRLPAEIENTYKARFVPFNQLLEKADIITIHTPLTSQTHHLIGEAELNQIKPSSFLINTSRGTVIDQDALIRVLQAGKIAGAALDVFANEPHIPPELLSMDNVIVTPHKATATKEVRRKMFGECFENIIAFFNGNEMTSRVV